MAFKIVSVILLCICYILIMMSFFYGLNRAKKVHNVNLKDVKNEVPGGFLLRSICSLIYYFCIIDWMIGLHLISWAYIPFPSWINIAGLAGIVLATAFFWQIGISLDSNYHGPLSLHENHKLVKTGPYAFIRHPTYTAFPLFHLFMFLSTSNYLILISGLVMSIYVNHKRIQIEEKLLLERFDGEYLEYMKTTGTYFPKFSGFKRN